MIRVNIVIVKVVNSVGSRAAGRGEDVDKEFSQPAGGRLEQGGAHGQQLPALCSLIMSSGY